MTPRQLLWLPVLLVCLGSVAAQGPAPALDALLGRLEASQSDLRTLSADFVQKNRVKLFKQEITSRGRLTYQRGQKGEQGALSQLRWEYLDPDPSTLWLTGKQAYLQMPGQKAQVFDLERDATVRAIFDDLELWLGNGSLRAAQARYDMSAAGPVAAPVLVLVPKAGSTLSRTFSRIELRLQERSLLLRSLLLVEKGGDEKEIVFSHMERNLALQKGVFQHP